MPMTDAPSTLTSVVERTQAVNAGAAVAAAHFLGRTAVFVLGEESLLLVPGEGEAARGGRARRRHPLLGRR